jgi:hypothetical protein
MAPSTLSLVSLDFDEIKNSIKTFLKAQKLFQDYNWEGSNLGVLIETLAYNSFLNGFYANMVASEQFIDSCQFKDSIISHAKELNYVPRSFRSAVATVDIQITPANTQANVLILKGTSFSSRVGSNTFSFTVPENIVIANPSGANTLYANSVDIFEGSYITDQYVMDYSLPIQRFVLSNPTVDTTSLTITVIEDSGSKVANYFLAESLYGLNGTSNNFFLQAAEAEKYEILFGDGVVGHRPKNGATIVTNYRACSGSLPNGASTFLPDGPIDNHSNVIVSTVRSATGGDVSETIESIRVNAPRHFKTQERAITPFDYETLLEENFPEIQAIAVFGGEELFPPQYGKVFITAELTTSDIVPTFKKQEYISFLKTRAPVNIKPIFIDPDILFVSVAADVAYSFTKTNLSPNDIRARVIGEIENYNTVHLDTFKAKVRFSRLLEAIDNAHDAILSSSMDLRLSKRVDIIGNSKSNFFVKFNMPIDHTFAKLDPTHPANQAKAVTSSQFIFNGLGCELEDDGNGLVRIVTTDGDNLKTLSNIGTVNYERGEIFINTFEVDFISNNILKFYAKSVNEDITASQNIILKIDTDDVSVDVSAVRDTA